MKRTKMILHSLTVLTLIAAFYLGALAVLSLFCCGRASSPVQGYLYANLAIGGVLAAILLQIVVIVLKIRNGQDVKREKWVVVFIVALLVVGASGAIGTRLPQLRSYEFAGGVGLILLALLALAVSWVLAWRGGG